MIAWRVAISVHHNSTSSNSTIAPPPGTTYSLAMLLLLLPRLDPRGIIIHGFQFLTCRCVYYPDLVWRKEQIAGFCVWYREVAEGGGEGVEWNGVKRNEEEDYYYY